MRVGLPIAAWLIMMPAFVWGTSLRLSTEVDLLVLDGKRVSSSLLKGADSIEIDNGPHQLVLKVDKNFSPSPRSRFPGLSSPLVISFDTKEIDQVNIVLSPKDDGRSVTSSQIKLLDEHAQPIPVRTDILETKPDPMGTDYEEETQRYNRSGRKASMPGFAALKTSDAVQNFAAAKSDPPPSQPETLTEKRLQYRFVQADKPTRARFLSWANKMQAP